jgi:hypothetical protein
MVSIVMADSGASNALVAPTVLINNEVLGALQFYFSQVTKSDLTLYLRNFYSTQEIVTVKNVLLIAAKGAYPEHVQQPVARRGANKRYS